MRYSCSDKWCRYDDPEKRKRNKVSFLFVSKKYRYEWRWLEWACYQEEVQKWSRDHYLNHIDFKWVATEWKDENLVVVK